MLFFMLGSNVRAFFSAVCLSVWLPDVNYNYETVGHVGGKLMHAYSTNDALSNVTKFD